MGERLQGEGAGGQPGGAVFDRHDAAGLGHAQQAAARALAACACLVAVAGGTPLTRRLVCEAARLDQGAVTLLVEDGPEDSFEDRARTAVLSGRTDLVGRRQ